MANLLGRFGDLKRHLLMDQEVNVNPPPNPVICAFRLAALRFMVVQMGTTSNFDPEDLIKIFEFLEIVAPGTKQ